VLLFLKKSHLVLLNENVSDMCANPWVGDSGVLLSSKALTALNK
jgi:hypothetical protein